MAPLPRPVTHKLLAGMVMMGNAAGGVAFLCLVAALATSGSADDRWFTLFAGATAASTGLFMCCARGLPYLFLGEARRGPLLSRLAGRSDQPMASGPPIRALGAGYFLLGALLGNVGGGMVAAAVVRLVG